jgi:hypothetical protein
MSPAVEPRNGLQARVDLRGLAIWVIRCLPLERGAQGIEQPIADTA